MKNDNLQHSLNDELRNLKTTQSDHEDFMNRLNNRLSDDRAVRTTLLEQLRFMFMRNPMISGAAMGVTAFVVLMAFSGRVGLENSLPEQIQLQEQITRVTSTVDTYAVPKNQIALVKFHFSSKVDMAKVKMRIELPNGISFWSDGKRLAQNEVVWTGALSRGENVFPVAVVADQEGPFEVMATAHLDSSILTHKVRLEIREEG